MFTRPQEDKYLKVGGVNTRYWAMGDKGSPVVLVHGLGGFIENWYANVDALAARHRVLVPDLPGFGYTDKAPLIRDIKTLVNFIHDFMQAVNIEKASLVGNSLGGGLVLQFALDYPQKVDRLVLVANAGMGSGVITDFKACSIPLLGELLIRPGLKSSESLWKKIVFDPTLVTPELVKASYDIVRQPGAKKALLAALRTGIDIGGQRGKLTRELLKNLGNIKAPTLIVWGREDRILPLAHAQIAKASIPGARLEIYDKCGHMPMLERPDEFNRLVLDFLAE